MLSNKGLSILAVALAIVFVGVVILRLWSTISQPQAAADTLLGERPTYTPTSPLENQPTETVTPTVIAQVTDTPTPTPTPTPTQEAATATPTSTQVCEVSVTALAELDQNYPEDSGYVPLPIPYITFHLVEENNLVPPVTQVTGEDGLATLYQTIPGCPQVSFTLYPDVPFMYNIYSEERIEGIGAGIHSEPYEFDLFNYAAAILPTPPAAAKQPGIPVNSPQGPTCKDYPKAVLPGGHDDVFIGAAADGSVWVNTQGTGVTRFDPVTETWKIFTSKDGLISNEVRKVEVAPNGVVWFGTTHGVSSWDGTTWQSYDASDGLFPDEVEAIGFGLDGMVWFASRNAGISGFNPANGQWHTWDLDGAENTYGLQFFSVFAAADGSLWFGTMSHGALRLRFPTGNLNEPEWTFVGGHGDYPDNPIEADYWYDEIPLFTSYGIDQTPDGTMWFSDFGVVGLTPDLKQYRQIGETAFFTGDLDVAPDGTIWAAMHGGLLHIFPDRDPMAPDAWVTYDFSSLIHNQRIVEVDVISDKVIWLYGWDAPVRCIFP